MAPHLFCVTSMVRSKGEVRAEALAERDAVAPDVRAGFAQRLASLGPRLAVEFAPDGATLVVALFSAMKGEPDTAPLLGALAAARVPTALPVAGAPATPLAFRLWRPGDPLRPGRFGTREPAPGAPAVDPDVLFVPLAAFDRRGHRIGYGKGYYDRTLQNLRARKPVRAIGVAFSVQEVLFVGNEAHDEPLDLVVTERDVLLCDG